MPFIDKLLEGGGNFVIELSGDSASFSPAGKDKSSLDSFQALVRRLRSHDGDGYRIDRDPGRYDDAAPLIGSLRITLAPGAGGE